MDSFVVNDDERIPEQESMPGPQRGRREQFRMLSPVPSSINLSTSPLRPPSNGHFTPELGRKQNPPNPPRQDSLIPRMPHEQAPLQPTPGPSATQWSGDLFHGKQQAIPFVILTFDSRELTLPPLVEPSQHN
ncbi:hypothetical protein O181_040758 [Austropuccinia psidii MF-1]|uniref:Uncharacterized protein n=1 Tax=Austropuccinia psidii MF-1 TaxID=1389203 RepID=A0A9Q3DHV0_9BASI|nr:hypothetical protein [Austropuccinia psidii MF-1]